MASPFALFNKDAIDVLMYSQEEARRINTLIVGDGQFLIALMRSKGDAGTLLKARGGNVAKTRAKLVEAIGVNTWGLAPIEIPFSPTVGRVFKSAVAKAEAEGDGVQVTPHHLLLALIEDPRAVIAHDLYRWMKYGQ